MAKKTTRRALMIARDHQALLRRVANIYKGPLGGLDPSPGGGGYAGPGGGKYIGPSRLATGGKVEKLFPRSKDPKAPINYGYDRHTSDVPVEWLSRMPGNARRLKDDEYAELKRQLQTEGIRNPLTILVGKRSRTAKLGEGNHRLMIARELGYTHVPARVLVGDKYGSEHGAQADYSHDLIPEPDKYFSEDAKPSAVFKSLQAPQPRASGGKVPPFKLHSGAAKLIAQKGQAKATPQQYAAIPGIKPDELKHSKFEALGSKAMPKEQVLEHLEGNTVPLQETVYTGDDDRSALKRYSSPSQSIALPGGENYREVLLHLPDTKTPVVEKNRALHAELERLEAKNREMFRAYATVPESEKEKLSAAFVASQKRAEEIQNEITKNSSANIQEYKSGHWEDVPNVVAHLRMHDRRGPNGEKVLHVEEVQSDWGQKGREGGFKGQKLWNPNNIEKVVLPRIGDEPVWAYRHPETGHYLYPANSPAEVEEMLSDNESNKPPAGPYVDNTQKWTDLALKRVLHEAAHGGYDKIAFTPGAEHNKRYSLSQRVSQLHYDPENEELYFLKPRARGFSGAAVSRDELPGYVGKEIAERLLASPLKPNPLTSDSGPVHSLKGKDLEVGGSGMRGYYDNILPKRLQSLAQQHDPQAKVQLGAAPMVDNVAPLHTIDVTPQMRDSIKQNGFNQFKRGGSVEDERIRAALARTVSPFSENPEHVKEALRIASTFQIPTTKTGPGGYYGIAQDRSPEEVSVKLAGLPGVKPKAVRKMSWEDLHKKGGSFINLGGDRSTFGRLTRINGEPLAWPVDLHAGPNYMRELNPGLVWANAPGHATSLTNVMRRAAEKGPVYGIYAPMGPRAVDSAHHMFDAVMAQIPGRNISKKDAAEFDAQIKQGLHMPPKKRAAAIKALEKWPGILNAKEASEFARTLPGEQRSGIVQHMDKKSWKDKGFPQIGVTRVAVTDPDVFSAPGNMLGHRVVQLDPDKMVAESKFKHGTYSAPTPGEYVGDVPLVQRHYAAPDVIEQRLLKPTVAGDIIHPYSAAPVGRSSARKIFEEQKNIQPLSQKQLDSVMLGLQRQKEYGLKRGGTVKRALDIAKKVTRG